MNNPAQPLSVLSETAIAFCVDAYIIVYQLEQWRVCFSKDFTVHSTRHGDVRERQRTLPNIIIMIIRITHILDRNTSIVRKAVVSCSRRKWSGQVILVSCLRA